MTSGYLIASILVLALFEYCNAGGHGGGHKKVIIHVPYKVKTIHHTHTVYKHVGGKEGGDEGYKVIGYSGDGDVSLGHGHEVHSDIGGESAGGFTVGGDHGYWHSGGHGDDDGHSAAIGLESSIAHDWNGGSGIGGGHGGDLGGLGGSDLGSHGGDLGGLGGSGFEGSHGGDLGGLGAYGGGHDLGGAALEGGYSGGHDLGGGASGYDLGSSDSYGNSISGGGHDLGGSIGGDYGGYGGGHKGYD